MNAEPPDISTRANPYVGPQTFQREQKDLFFGREAEANELIALVVARRIVLFYSESGAGKSSLINARLIPRLEKERHFEVLPIGRVGGEAPDVAVDNIYIYNLMTCLCHERLDAERCGHLSLSEFLLNLVEVDGHFYFREEGETAVTEAASAMDAQANLEPETAQETIWPRLLIIDQFEELFTTHAEAWEKRRDFFAQLAKALEDDPFLYVVLSMREDHIAKLSTYARLLPGELRSRYRMQRMRKQAAIEAITGPAARAGIHFAAEAVNDLVGNLLQVQSVVGEEIKTHEGPFVEPVQLQVVCFRLWELLVDDADGNITREELHAIVHDDLSEFVSTALADFYESALGKVLPKVDERVGERQIRDWFSNELITPTGTRNLVFQGEVSTGSLPNPVVKLLEDQFLIRGESRASGKWYELVHDRFVAPIQRANETWDEEQIQHDPLALAARQWDQNERSADLLYRDRPLQRALSTVKWATLTPLVQQFLTASRDAQQAREMEDARRQAEQSQDRARVALQQAERERVISNRLKLQRAVMIAALIVALIAAATAWLRQQTVAARNQTIQTQVAELESKNTTIEQQVAALKERDAAITAQNNLLQQREQEITERNNQLLLSNQALETEKLRSSALALVGVARTGTGEQVMRALVASAALSRTQRLDPIEDESLRLDARNALYQALVDYGARALRPSSLNAGISGLAYSPDGSTLAAGYTNGQVYIWDLRNGTVQQILADHDNTVFSVAYHPSGAWLASGSDDGTVIVWDVASGERVHTLHLPVGIVAVTFNPAGDLLASADFNGNVTLWDANRGEEVRHWHAHDLSTQEIAFTPDGQILLTGGEDGTAASWDVATGRELQRLHGHTEAVTHVAISADGRYWATASNDGSAVLWDPTTGAQIRQFCCHEGWIDGIAFSPDGTLLATASQDYTVGVWSVESGRRVQLYTDHTDHVWGVAFSPDGRSLASVSSDGAVRIHDLASDLIVTMPKPVPFGRFSTSADAQTWAALETGTRILQWQQDDPSPRTIDTEAPIVTFALNPAGSQLAVLTTSGRIEVWDSGAQAPTGYATSPNADMSAAQLQWSGDDELVLILPEQQPPLRVLDNPALSDVLLQAVTQITTTAEITVGHYLLDQNGQQLATVTVSGTLWLWQSASNTPIRVTDIDLWSLPAADANVDPVLMRFSADGRYLAVREMSHVLLIWDTQAGAVLTRVDLAASILDLDFDDESRLALLLRTDGAVDSVHLFDLRFIDNAPLVVPLTASTQAVRMGRNVIYAVQSDVIRQIQLLPNTDLLALTCARAYRNLTYGEWLTIRRDMPNINDTRICAQRPVDGSILRAYLLEGPADVPLDLSTSGLTDAEQVRITLSVAQEQIDVGNFAVALDLLAQAEQVMPTLPDWAWLHVLDGYRNLCKDTSGDLQQAACAGLVARALAAEDEVLIDTCAYSVTFQLPNQVLPICQQAATVATASTAPNALQLNARLCLLVPPVHAPDLFDATCRRMDELTPPIAFMTPVTGTVNSVEGDLYRFTAQSDLVTIEMVATQDQPFDTYLTLYDSTRAVLTSNDDHVNTTQSLILSYPVTRGQIYYVRAHGFEGGSGGYRLTVLAEQFAELDLTAPVTATFADGMSWRFTGNAHDLITLRLQSADLGTDSHLTLQSDAHELVEQATAATADTTLLLKQVLLPATGEYWLTPRHVGSTAAYTLTYSTDAAATIPLDQEIVSALREQRIWQFDGQSAQFLTLNFVSDDDNSVRILNADGDEIASLSTSADSPVLLSQHPLPADGTYYVEIRYFVPNATYTMTLHLETPPLLAANDVISATAEADYALWRVDGQPQAVLSLQLDAGDDSAAYLELLNRTGTVIAYSEWIEDRLLIQTAILQDDPPYFVRVLNLNPGDSYQLSSLQLPQAELAFGDTVDLLEDAEQVWTFAVEEISFVSISVTNAIEHAYMRLLHSDGSVIDTASGQSLGLRNRQLSPGRYFIHLGGIDDAASATLTLTATPPPVLLSGQSVESSTMADTWWQFEANAGDQINILLAGASPNYDPYLVLYDSQLNQLASSDDNGEGWSGYDAEIAALIAPESGTYYIEAGRSGSSEPYVLTLTLR